MKRSGKFTGIRRTLKLILLAAGQGKGLISHTAFEPKVPFHGPIPACGAEVISPSDLVVLDDSAPNDGRIFFGAMGFADEGYAPICQLPDIIRAGWIAAAPLALR